MRYRLDSGKVTWLRDRNGNKTTFTYQVLYGGYSWRLLSATDSLNRQVSVSYNDTIGNYDEITYKGFGGASRSLKVWHHWMHDAMRPDHTIKKANQLFPEVFDGGNIWSGDYDFDQAIVSKVELPDGRTYRFYYNSFGEVARVILPTGGGADYDYAPVYYGGGMYYNSLGLTVMRRLTKRTTYNALTPATLPGNPPAGTVERLENYVKESAFGTGPTTVRLETRAPDNTLLTQSKIYLVGNAADSLANLGAASYSDWRSGKEYKTEAYQVASGAPGSVLRVNDTNWSPSLWGSGCDCPAPNPTVAETINTLADSNQVTKQTFSYDQYNNRTDSYEYDYGTGAAGALVRRTHTDYLTSGYDTVVGGNYTPNLSATVHLRNLPTQTQVFDASSNKKAETQFEYDNYTPDANHAALVNRVNISGLDAAFTTSYTTRGNVTKVSSWRNTDNAYLSAYSQYDIAGNVVKAIDANGNATTIDFADRFGAPDGEAQANSPPPAPGSTWLNGQTTFAFPTKITNALGHIAYTQIDYFLGRPVDTEDANNVKNSLYYNDALDRPTKGLRAVGTALVNQTLITYDDINKTITTATDKDAYQDGVLQSKALYDGLGRAYRAARLDVSSQWSIVETQFDALGRAYRSSNPFRAASVTAALPANPEWTTSSFDALSRVTQVTTPDGATVGTSYSGNTVTVTDQAGKQRRSLTDALGRLLRVDEPNGCNSCLGTVAAPTQATSYSYDTLDNLTTVTQGAQTRSFTYDSLKRLTQATNPESGATSYSYDNNGNLTFKVDALNRMTWYLYDALNRNQQSYTNNANTPQVVHVYDTATNGKGRLGYSFTTSYWVGSTSSDYLTLTPIDAYDALGRPLVQRQHYWNGSNWGNTYQVSRTYDLAGNMKSQTYPSGRVVNYDYNTAGQMTTFKGNLGDGVNRVYASEMAYSAAGQMTKEAWGKAVSGYGGMTTPLYQNKHYNNRQQLYDIRLGTNGSDEWTWNRGALRLFYDSNFAYGNGGTNNNGNVYRMDHFVPGDDAVSTWTMSLDYYGYDELNRITGIWENKAAHNLGETSTGLTQQYVYDRYGNRTVNNAVSNFPGVYNQPFTVNTVNNRLQSSGSCMTYDAVGNLTNDCGKTRSYDANNKMVSANDNGVATSYRYDANGQRTVKTVGSVTTWNIYGMGGELVAEYAANGAVGTPQKEYGYRGSQLLVVYDSTETGNKQMQWLLQDHLGSTRMVVDLSGSLTGMKRHDYLPFGEEIGAGVGIRTAAQGYPPPDDKIRQKFTGYEKDVETGLDYAQARMFSGAQGRFASVDPQNAGAKQEYPQSWNGYSYVINNPLRYSDPNGLSFLVCDTKGNCSEISDADAQKYTFNRTYQKQNGYFTKNDGKIYNLEGQIIGTYINQGDDRWSDWQRATVRETARQLDNPAVKTRAAINALSGKSGTQSLTSKITSIAQKFRLYQCSECAEAIIVELQKEGIHGELIEIRSQGDYMISERTGSGQTITKNGKHLGVRIGDTVYDNIYTEGISYREWLTKFEGIGGIRVTKKKGF